MKRKCMILILLFLAGIFAAQLFGTDFLRTYGFLNEYHLRTFSSVKISKLDLFWNILWERGKIFLLIALLASTPIRRFLLPSLGCLLTFLTGFYGASCVICEGGWGMGLFLVSIFPHGLLYAAAVFGLLRTERPLFYINRKYRLSYLLAIGIMLLCLIIGCVLEAGVGSVLMQRLLSAMFR